MIGDNKLIISGHMLIHRFVLLAQNTHRSTDRNYNRPDQRAKE